MASGKQRLKRMHDGVARLTSKTITVGVHKDSGNYNNGMTVAQVALINHFGSLDGKIPERPFLTIAKKESNEEIQKIMSKALRVASNGGDGVKVFKRAGDVLANRAKGVIGSTESLHRNAGSTIAKKGKDAPLYDTGKLKSSIKSKME